ncbi:hypothetical protein [Ensifer sp. R-19]|uniref:hypothetical protein n=1 Tax=Ensifer sp. R-19 TaxID=3404055 RepID=UPI003CF7A2CE
MRVLKILPLVASLLAGGWAMAAPQNDETAIAVKWYEAFDRASRRSLKPFSPTVGVTFPMHPTPLGERKPRRLS